MKQIALNRGKIALVDDEDYESLSPYPWHVGYHGDACRRILVGEKPKIIRMHRIIMDAPDGLVVDHINGDKLDNQRSNLRICSQRNNSRNRRKSTGKGFHSVFKGVTRCGKRWRAYIRVDYERKWLGLFDTEVEAARAYDEAARYYFGEFAQLNLPNHCVEQAVEGN